jgi:hypothetical protein
MNLKDWYLIPIVATIVIVSAGLFVADLGIEDDGLSSFLSSANDMKEQAEESRLVMEEKTSAKGLEGFIENIPIFGDMAKAGKFVASIAGTIRSGFDMFVGFFRDMLISQVLGIPSVVVALVMVAMVGSFGFAVYRSLRGND